MNLNKKTSILIAILVIAIVVVGWRILAKGGLLAIQLPQPQKIQTADLASTAAQAPGEVLGENSDYTNPLKDIYVNPFSK